MSKLLFEPFAPLAAIAITPHGARKLEPLCKTIGANLWLPNSLSNFDNAQTYTGSLQEHLASLWHSHHGFIFSLATGAVVRLIAPLLENKHSDPAIIVVDQNGKFVISLCSGHQGGADQLTNLVARQLNATPVLTGASTSLKLPAIDTLGIPFGWQKGEGDWNGLSAAIARGEAVQVIQEAGSTLWQQHLPSEHTFDFNTATNTSPTSAPTPTTNSLAKIYISPKHRSMEVGTSRALCKGQWHPRVLWVGIGCERGTSRKVIETAIEQTFHDHNLAEGAIAGIATIDLKADEAGILELCKTRNLPLRTFPPEVLSKIEVPNPSTVVNQEVGTPSVAEAAAIQAAKTTESKEISDSLIVSKQIFRLTGETGAVTVAIAQAEQEYTGRTGKLFLVGTGPGELSQITPAAQTAVTQADAVIGYSLYLDLISSLSRPGQIIEGSPITQEKQRAQRAIELAQWGLSVAVVSSGDCGIYGMAGLVLELLQTQGWDGKNPQVEVFPGISALQAAAARVGAPLMHDFCAISLSDLLTPWSVIIQRLEAAAQADFVTAIYNPRSRTRIQQIVTAQEIFLRHRSPQNPVAIVRCAYRQEEEVIVTNLENMLEFPIDMLTTVIIGNQSSCHYGNWIITPRGYLKGKK